MPVFLDADAETLRVLEFGALLEWVAGHAASPAGRRAVRATRPSADLDALDAQLALLDEMLALLAEDGRVLPSGIPDADPAVELLTVENALLEPRTLVDLARVVTLAADAVSRLRRLDRERFPGLQRLAVGVPELRAEAAAIIRGTDPEGSILDAASPELARIRRRAARQAERVRSSLQRRVRDPAAGDWARDDYVTERNGRFVIPVRVDAPHPPKGIVHATSASGATRFVEPLDVVETNNERVRLREAERAEELRIVESWADAFRARFGELGLLLELFVRLDALQARASFGRECGGQRPRVGRGGDLDLRGVRHPLLWRHLREIGGRCVPLDLSLRPFDRTLVVSGPNTGGKTVALKTLGLAVLMAQSALPVPGDDVRLPLYERLRADIGDRQSIHADLSTFSAHVEAMRRFLAEASGSSLLLLDEPGTGTEPAEGAALAIALLEALAAEGRTIAVTTHLGTVKAWAVREPRVEIAATEFDESSLRPTYRLLLGVPGSSSGLEIAERIGLDSSVVERARGLLDEDDRAAEGYLRRLRELVQAKELELRAVGDRRLELEARAAEDRERGDRERLETRRRVERELDEALRDVDRSARRELAAMAKQGERTAVERRWSRARGRLERGKLSAVERIAGGGGTDEPAEWLAPDRVEPGSRVRVRGFEGEGSVLDVSGESVEIRLGPMRLRVSLDDLGRPEGDPAPPQGGTGFVRAPERGQPVAPELRLVGMRAGEASSAVERYLDAARLAGHSHVRLIHGHGTGALRRVVRELLGDHPLVARQRPGGPEEGGDGVTIVELR